MNIRRNLLRDMTIPAALWLTCAAANGQIYVTNEGLGGPNGTSVGEYTISGATVNSALVTGLTNNPLGIVESGGDLFVANFSSNDTIGEYDATTGATVNPALITGVSFPFGLATSDGNLFVTNYNIGTIGEYTTSGATVNASLITGLANPTALTISGEFLYVASLMGGSACTRLADWP